MRPSAGIWPLAQGDARGSGHHHRRPGDRARSRRPARKADPHDLGSARQVRISASKTLITAGAAIKRRSPRAAPRCMRQYDAAPHNIEQDKLRERLAKLSGGTAMILAGGVTPVEQKRRIQLIEDAINATRAAIEEGIVPGGGVALLRAAPLLDGLDRWTERRRQTGSGTPSTRVEPSVLLHCRQCRPER